MVNGEEYQEKGGDILLKVEGEESEARETSHHQASKPDSATPKKEESIKKSILKSIFLWQILSMLFFVLFIVSLFASFSGGSDIGKQGAKERVQEYVDSVLSRQDISAVLGDVEEERGLYKVGITIEGQTINSYVTKDGVLFFPNVVNLDRFAALGNIVVPPDVDVEGDIDDDLGEEEPFIEENESIENPEDENKEEE